MTCSGSASPSVYRHNSTATASREKIAKLTPVLSGCAPGGKCCPALKLNGTAWITFDMKGPQGTTVGEAAAVAALAGKGSTGTGSTFHICAQYSAMARSEENRPSPNIRSEEHTSELQSQSNL